LWVSFSEILIILILLIRNKYLAVNIGPVGLGIFSLLTSFFTLLSVFGGAWLQTGAAKLIAEYKNDNETKLKIYSFNIIAVTIISIIITIISFVFFTQIKEHFLSKDIPFLYYALFAAGFIGLCIKPVLNSILQGLKKAKMVSYYRGISAVIEIILIVILIKLFNLDGFFISIFISSILTSILLFWAVSKLFNKKIMMPSYKENVTKNILRFGYYHIGLTFFDYGNNFIQRFLIIRQLDIASVGIYQAGISIMNFMGILNRGIIFNVFPEMSQNLDKEHRIKSINNYLKFSIIINMPIIITAMFFSQQIIPLLFSDKFNKVNEFIYFLILAQFFNIIADLFQVTTIALSALKIHTYFTTFTQIIILVVSLFLINKLGLIALALAVLISSIMRVILYGRYIVKTLKYNFFSKIIFYLVYLITALTVSILLKDVDLSFKITLDFLFIASLFFFITSNERKYLISMVKNRK
jgi:O-antigen/teichoic acid export membrane protein